MSLQQVDPEKIDSVEALQDAMETIRDDVDRIDGNVNGFFSRVSGIDDRLDEIEQRLDDLEQSVTKVDASVPEQSKNKIDNVESVLDYAVNHATGGRNGVKVDTGEVGGQINGSRDTALRLMDDIGSKFQWADVDNPGGPKPKQLKLAVGGRTIDELMADVVAQYGE